MDLFGADDPAPRKQQKRDGADGPRRREPRDPEFDRRARRAQWTLPPATPEETAFRHSGWAKHRTRVRECLASSGTSTFGLERWDACGSECCVEVDRTREKVRVRANYCRSRHCQPCARARAGRIAVNLRQRMAARPRGRYRFITLTLRHSDQPLAAQLKRLYACFKKLRTSKIWKSTQRGGVLMCEVKRDASNRNWHPHLHVISEGDYVDQAKLADAWHRVTGDSHVVHITAIPDAAAVVHYVTKYVTKGVPNDVWSNRDTAQEWISASRGLRIAATFGDWRGFRLMNAPQDDGAYVKLCSMTSLLQAVWRKEEWACGLLRRMKRNPDDLAAYECQQRPPPAAEEEYVP